MPKRTVEEWSWENPRAQDSFLEYVGFDDEQKSAEQVVKIEKLLGLSPCKGLDVGCGNGRQTTVFARRGYSMTGIDVSESFLRAAKERAQKENFAIDYRLMRASEITEQGVYDFALAFHHSIGFLPEKELPVHFSKICKSLKPGGKFLFEMAGPKLTTKPWENIRNWTESENKFVLVEKKLENGYRLETCIEIEKESGNITELREKQRAFSLAEIQTLLSEAGFRLVCSYCDLEKTPANADLFGVFVCFR